MDYETIDSIMAAKGLATNPAFDDLTIAIEPIPCFNSCPLGLYFPVEEWSPNLQRVVSRQTIVLPPDATEGALFHELGHRHGHYHYDNLSERYAEDFRKKYQKGRALLYLGNDLGVLPRFGALFDEGEKGAVEIALLQPLTPDELYEIRSQLYSYGETPKVSSGNSEVPWVRVEFTKGIDWLVIISAVAAGVVVLTAASLGYALYKTAEKLPWIMPVSLFAFGAYIVLRSATSEAKKLAERR